MTIPEREIRRHRFVREVLDEWRAWYGTDFGPLGAMPCSNLSVSVRPHVPREWPMLGEPVLVAEFDFQSEDGLRIDNRVPVCATAAGTLSGVLIFFELKLGASTWFSTHPAVVNPDSSWDSKAWILADPLRVEPGDSLALTYRSESVQIFTGLMSSGRDPIEAVGRRDSRVQASQGDLSVSVIIPVYQSARQLARCLTALAASAHRPLEIIVVDDGSTDDSAEAARQAGAAIVRVEDGPRGPAFARNVGAAQARGDILFFLDADVLVHRDSLAKFVRCLTDHPDVAAVFGSYDDEPDDRSLVSQYRNLLHHFVHQQGRLEASTFWAGCGVIRREVFEQVSGFDNEYRRPSIEDIELGGRLRQAGHRVWLRPDIQATHLKRWTFWGIVRSDVRDRAVPWTRLILRQGRLPQDLNTSLRSRASAVVAWTIVLAASVAIVTPWAGWVALAGLAALLALNSELYRFFLRKRGAAFAALAFVMHGLYLLYSSATFWTLACVHVLRGAARSA